MTFEEFLQRGEQIDPRAIAGFRNFFAGSELNIEIFPFNEPSTRQAAGFAAPEAVYLNEHFLRANNVPLSFKLFAIIHECVHGLEFRELGEETLFAHYREDFERFFEINVQIERRVDARAEQIMRQINIEAGHPAAMGINKQPFDAAQFMMPYKEGMRKMYERSKTEKGTMEQFLKKMIKENGDESKKKPNKSPLDLIRESLHGKLDENQPAPAKPNIKPAIKPGTKPIPAPPRPGIPFENPKIHEKPRPKAKSPNPEVAPAKPGIKPGTKPVPAPPRPGIPHENPKIHEKPRPKAGLHEDARIAFIAKAGEYMRMKLMMEAPMDPGPIGQPHPNNKSAIEKNDKGPFSKIDLFKKRLGNQTALEKLGSEEWQDTAKNFVDKVGRPDPYKQMQNYQQIFMLEQPHQAQLEELAKITVQRIFGVPEHIMAKITAKLVAPGTIAKEDFDDQDQEEQPQAQAQPKAQQAQNPNAPKPPAPAANNQAPADQLMDDFTDEEKAFIKKHVDKRIISNALMMGAGYKSQDVLHSLKNQIDAIDRRLYPLYMNFFPFAEFSLWQVPLDSMEAMGAREIGGKAELVFDEQQEGQENGDANNEPEEINNEPNQDNLNPQEYQPEGGEGENNDPIREAIGARAIGTQFPILLHEVAKAVIEFLFAYGLPKARKEVRREIMKQSDSFADEHWMKLIGPRLWKHLHDATDYIVNDRGGDYTVVSTLLYKIGTLEPEEFVNLMDLIIHDGPAAINALTRMLDQLQAEIDAYEAHNNREPRPEEIVHDRPNHAEIGVAARNNEADLLDDDTPDERLAGMSPEQLKAALTQALGEEKYILAARLRDEINNRK